jgi:polyphosphate kinase
MRHVASAERRGNGWLDVLARVLSRASDERIPVLERARLLAVFSLHLDDFFMIHSAGTGPSGPLHERLQLLTTEHDRLLHDVVLPALTAEGLGFPRWDDLNSLEQDQLRELFRDVIHPLLTPLVVDASHPFPHVTALSLNLGVLVGDPRSGAEKFVYVQVPTRLPGFVRLDARRLVCIDTLVSASLDELFQGMHVLEQSSFRVTRNQEFDVDDDDDDDDDDDPPHMWQAPTIRDRVGVPVRLEVEDTTSARMLGILVRNLHVADDDVYRVRAPLGIATTMLAIADAQPSGRRGSRPAVLPRSPYTTSGRAFLQRASRDPAVRVIAQTLDYRCPDSTLVDALIDAARAGKQVLVVLESCARDRERTPSTLEHRLVSAGCQVVPGLARVRGACVLGLAMRAMSRGVRWYAHLGTPGHYLQPEGDMSDLGLVSTDPDVCSDVAHLLLRLSESSRPEGDADPRDRPLGPGADPEPIDLAQ